jgi:K+-sensing histidine kinase KdpD
VAVAGQTINHTEKFVRAVSDGVHDLAQPLTAALGGLELARDSQTVAEYREAMERALADLEQTLQIMAYVRQLLRAQTPAHDLTALPVNSILEQTIEDMRIAFEDEGIRVVLRRESTETVMTLPESGFRQIVFSILQGMRSVCSTGDSILIQVTCGLEEMVLRITGTSTTAQAISQGKDREKSRSMQQSLAVAEATLASMQASLQFECDAEGFTLLARFPGGPISGCVDGEGFEPPRWGTMNY